MKNTTLEFLLDDNLELDETGEYYYACGIPNHKNCTFKFPIIDIRKVDKRGDFGYPERYEQLRDWR